MFIEESDTFCPGQRGQRLVTSRRRERAGLMLQTAAAEARRFYFESTRTGHTFIIVDAAEAAEARPPGVSSAAERGRRERGRPDGGDRCCGAPQPGRRDQLAAEPGQNLSPVCCSQRGVLVGVMTQWEHNCGGRRAALFIPADGDCGLSAVVQLMTSKLLLLFIFGEILVRSYLWIK